MMELWKSIPTGIKIAWIVSALMGLTVTGLVIVLLIKLVMKL